MVVFCLIPQDFSQPFPPFSPFPSTSCLLSERRDVIFDSLPDWADSWSLVLLKNSSHANHICDVIGYVTKLRFI